MTEINGAEIEAVDVICFGSPCQSLSLAGKREGLKHEALGDGETTRSGLFMEAVRIIKEMRRATNGEYPRFAVWENVPGAFSSNKGEDFRTVLEELIKIAEPEAPPIPSPGKAGWPYADCLVGDGWSLAWRVFDAQYWGVPQRRRRIYLVLDLGGQSAGKVLFEREGLRGHSAESGTPWQAAAGNTQSRSGADDPESRIGRSASESGIAATLYAAYGTKWNGNAGAYSGENFILEPEETPKLLKIRSGCEGGGKGPLIQDNISATLACNNDQYLFQPIAVATQQGGAEISENGICPTVTAAAGMSGNNQPWICCKNAATFIIDNIGGQAEYGKESPVNGTLRAGGHGAVCYGISSYDSNGMKSANPHSGIYEAETSRTLDLNGGNPACNQGGVAVVEPVCYDARGNGAGDIAPTITGDHNNRVTDYTALCMTTGSYMQVTEEVSPTLMARDYKDPNCVCDQYIIRRLTPTECARLQGFPDRWGDIPQKDTFTDEEHSFWLEVRNTHAAINGRATKEYTRAQMLTWYNKLHSDSSEYKMYGNGVALPNVLYVMQGIKEALCKEKC